MFYIIIIFISIVISYLIYRAYSNTKDIQINKINVPSQLSSKENSPFTILHLSDLHLENISLTPDELEKKLINESIDLIALTGDFLDRKRSIPKLKPYLHVLNKLQPTYGIYAVLGNHDYVLKEKNLQQLINTLERYNCRVMRNEHDTILVKGQRINIIGIDDYSTNRSDLSKAFHNIPNGINIVLTHDPTVVLKMNDYSFDYLMAGHFHGGQICYPKAYHLVKMGELARRNIIKGLHSYQEKHFYISEGLGQTGLNIRVGSRPEITFHQLMSN